MILFMYWHFYLCIHCVSFIHVYVFMHSFNACVRCARVHGAPYCPVAYRFAALLSPLLWVVLLCILASPFPISTTPNRYSSPLPAG
jgi:hypothetical protein